MNIEGLTQNYVDSCSLFQKSSLRQNFMTENKKQKAGVFEGIKSPERNMD